VSAQQHYICILSYACAPAELVHEVGDDAMEVNPVVIAGLWPGMRRPVRPTEAT
jgi:hypothetical protein